MILKDKFVMKNEKISVIVPVYNVEIYLNKCVDSILAQSYKNLEIILVDDGSCDKSGEICDQYSKIDERVIVVHKKNGGLSSARNAGLDLATGKFIGFVDSDDWIELEMYEYLYRFATENQCSVVECAVNNVYGNDIVKYIKDKDVVLSGRDAISMQLDQVGNNLFPRIAVWSKLFDAKFWEHRRFPEGKIHEDYMLTCEAFYKATKVGLVRKGLYYHLYTNKSSIINSKFGEKDLFLAEQYKKRVEYFEKEGDDELRIKALRQYYYVILTIFWKCALNNMEQKSYYQKELKQNKKDIMKLVTGVIKYQFKLAIYCPKVYLVLRRIVEWKKRVL